MRFAKDEKNWEKKGIGRKGKVYATEAMEQIMHIQQGFKPAKHAILWNTDQQQPMEEDLTQAYNNMNQKEGKQRSTYNFSFRFLNKYVCIVKQRFQLKLL